MYLYIDIETLPGPVMPTVEEVAALAPGTMKKPETIQKWAGDNQEAVYRKQALDSMAGRILCIGYAVDDAPARVIYDAKDEVSVLSEFEDVIEELQQHGAFQHIWVGQYVSEFDLQWIWRRAVKYDFLTLRRAIPRERYSKRIEDTKALWAGPDWKNGNCSLASIAKFLGIECKSDLDGSMVYDAWLVGEHERINEYCKQDVEVVREIHKRITIR